MEEKKGIGLGALIAVVVTLSIGAGIFDLSQDLSNAAYPGPALIAWAIVGIGIMMLCLCFNNLILKDPESEGIFVYAEKGFGRFAGFISGWGYWLAAWLGNVAFATILMSTIGYFYKPFSGNQTLAMIVIASIIAWILTYFISKGIEGAAFINAIVTVAKLIPLFTFIVVAIMLFKADVFTKHFWDNINTGFSFDVVFPQIKGSFMVMMWVFVGIEGASMLSSRAKKKSDAGRATIIGVSCLIIIYVLASILPYGYLPKEELAKLDSPAMAYIFKSMVGPWGGAFISIGLIISILGSWLSWTILPAETLMLMSKRKLIPEVFGKTNKNNAPIIGLIVSGILVQVFLITLLFTDKAYNFAYSLSTAATVITYSFAAAYQIKYSLTNKQESGYQKQVLIGVIALTFQIVGILLAGFEFVLLVLLAYIPGIFIYLKAQRENGITKISNGEKIWFIVIAIGGIIAITGLILGYIIV